jgi:1,4-alpha-glucan branching enzyme
VQDLVRDLNRLYRGVPALYELDVEPEGFQWIDSQDAANSVLAVLRQGKDARAVAVGVFNFSGLVRRGYRVGVPYAGRWREILNTDASRYGGRNEGNLGGATSEPVAAHGMTDSLSLTLPALGAVVFVPEAAGESTSRERDATNGVSREFSG